MDSDYIALSFQNGERDFRYLAEVTQAVHDLHVPPTALQHTAPLPMCSTLPEVVRRTHEHRHDEVPVATGVDANTAATASNSDMHTDENEDNIQLPVVAGIEPVTEANETHDQTAEIDYRDMITQLTCKICFSAVVGIIFLPCGHLVCCVSCAPAMVDCPICRKTVNGTVQAFMP